MLCGLVDGVHSSFKNSLTTSIYTNFRRTIPAYVMSVFVVLLIHFFITNGNPTQLQATKEENGITYHYSIDDGQETLQVVGPLPKNFDHASVLSKFHDTLGIGGVSSTTTEDDSSKSLLESVGEYLAGKQFLSNVRQYYQTMSRTEVHEELQQARNQLESVNEELSRALTQQMILRKRQADLGAYLEKSVNNNNRNPTVEDLVLTEDDRLHLLEYRLKRIIEKLRKQKEEVERFIKLHEAGAGFPSSPPESTTKGGEVHIFTSKLHSTVSSKESEKEKV